MWVCLVIIISNKLLCYQYSYKLHDILMTPFSIVNIARKKERKKW